MASRFSGAILILLASHFFLPVLAQTQAAQPVKIILIELEKKYNVAFSYAEATLVGVKVTTALPRKNLNETLSELTKQTGLVFQTLKDRYIVVVKPEKTSVEKVCGIVRSMETGMPLEGATIQSGTHAAVTNLQGFFEITKGSEPFQIRSLGYQSIEVPATEFDSTCKAIILPTVLTTLEEVTVADFVASGIEKKIDGSLTVQSKVLGILPGLPEPDALQVLQYLPGIRSVTEAAADINIRGGTNDQNLVTIDGIKVYQTGHFFGLISGFNPHMSERVTVTRNGTSAYYGDGVSGTIAIQSAHDVKEKFSGSGGINMLYADLNFSIPLSSRMSLQVAGRHSVPSSWQTPTYQKYFRRAFQNTQAATTDSLSRQQQFSFFDVNAKWLYDLSSKDKLRVSFFTIGNNLDFNEKTNNISIERKNELTQQSGGAGAEYNRFWTDRLKTTVEAYASRYTLDAVNQNVAANQQLVQGNKVEETGLKFSAFNQLTKNIYLHGGYQFYETGITNVDRVNNPPFNRLVKEVMRTQSAFAEVSFSNQKENLNVRVGGRVNYYTGLTRFSVEPRVVINQKIDNNFSIEVQAERKTQAALQVIDFQNDFLGVERRRWILANTTDVPLVTGDQVSMGVTYNNERWLLTTEGYLKNVSGILTSSQGFQNQFQFIRSAGQYNMWGMDMLTNYRAGKADAWFGYSFSKNDYEFSGLVPPGFVNSLDIRHMLSGGASYKFSRVDISLGASWHSGRPYTRPVPAQEVVAGAINYEDPNAARLKNYFRIDFSARWFFYFSEGIRSHAGISIWNVLDRENELNQFYTLQSGMVRATRQNSLAFTPNIFFRVEF